MTDAWTKAVEAAAAADYAAQSGVYGFVATWDEVGEFRRATYISKGDAALRAALASLEAEGWRLVPKEPMPEMLKAIRFGPYGEEDRRMQDMAELGWRRGLAAAPRLPGTEEK